MYLGSIGNSRDIGGSVFDFLSNVGGSGSEDKMDLAPKSPLFGRSASIDYSLKRGRELEGEKAKVEKKLNKRQAVRANSVAKHDAVSHEKRRLARIALKKEDNDESIAKSLGGLFDGLEVDGASSQQPTERPLARNLMDEFNALDS